MRNAQIISKITLDCFTNINMVFMYPHSGALACFEVKPRCNPDPWDRLSQNHRTLIHEDFRTRSSV